MHAAILPAGRAWMLHPATRIAIVVAIMLLAHFRWLPMPWRQPVVGLIALAWVWLETGGPAAMGLRWPAPLKATLGWAALATAVVVGVVTPMLEPWLNRVTGTPVDYSGYGALVGNAPAALTLAGKALLSAAIGEELIYRGFLLHQLIALFGGRRPGTAVAVLVAGAVFGLAHATQGLVGVLLTGVVGVWFGALFVLARRNLWALMLAHAVVDLWGIATLYLGWY